MENNYRSILVSGIQQLSLDISNSKLDLLLAYHALLVKWNKAYNLTAVRNPKEMISRHLLDSLSIIPYVKGQRFIDVGAGAGLPGIVLAIVFPERSFDLLDSNGKKTRFLFQVKTELNLDNVNVIESRVENHSIENLYDGVMSRAFATLVDMVQGSQQLLSQDGFFYAMKGVYPQQELERLRDLQKNYTVDSVQSLTVPGEEGQRHLVILCKS